MLHFRILPQALRRAIVAGLYSGAAVTLALGTAAATAPPALAAPAKTVRAEVGKPLQAAQQAFKKKRYKDALAQIAKAEAVGNRTAYETYLIAETRASVHLAANQPAKAAQAIEAAMATGQVPAQQRPRQLQVLANLAYQQKDYRQAIAHAGQAIKAGIPAADLRPLLAQSHYMAGDHRQAAELFGKMVEADERAGRTPDQDTLQLLLSVAYRSGDEAAYSAALRKLVTHHPTPQYWRDMVAAVEKRPGFSPRLALEADRLLLQVGAIAQPERFMELGQELLLANLPAEAEAALSSGFAAGVLGVGPQAERHGRLLAMAKAQAVQQGERLQNAGTAGLDPVTLGLALSGQGQTDRAIRVLRDAVARAEPAQADHVRLSLGRILLSAGKPDQARQILTEVKAPDGSSDLARLWLLRTGVES